MKQIVWFISIALAFAAGYFTHTLRPLSQIADSQLRERNSIIAESTDGEGFTEASSSGLEPISSEVVATNTDKKLSTKTLTKQLNAITTGDPMGLSFSDFAALYQFIAELTELEVLALIREYSSQNIEKNNTAFSALFSRYVEINPTEAIDFVLNELDDENIKKAFLTMGITALSKQDPLAAYDYFLKLNEAGLNKSMSDQHMLSSSLLGTFAGLAKQDMALALDKLYELNQLGFQIYMPMHGITKELESKQEFLDLLNLTQSFDDHEIEEAIIRQWTSKNPEQVGAWLIEEYTGDRYEEIKSRFVRSWSYQDREKSGDWLIAHSAPEKLRGDVEDFMRSWGWEEPEAAMQWFMKQPKNVYNQRNFGDFLKNIAMSQPKFAIKYLSLVDNEKTQSSISYSIYYGLKSKSTSQADAFLEESSFKDDILELAAKINR